ncbi:MAG: cobyrinate a,c-diamide synthase, partial [Clostridiales bacterium]|nr:cobyrinate a,c-diamide synthase [Clostridiales bacterium]
VYFSPLRDEALPPDIGGLWLCGGYPELYARRLAQNKSMLRSIKAAIDSGLPTIAECGGFMYLHERLADSVGTGHEMVGVIKGVAFPTEQLIRFGYLTLTAKKDNLLCEQGGSFRVHEFHYWDSTACGEDFRAKKAAKDIEWDCAHASGSLYAGFPHLYLYAAPETGVNFVNKARNFQNNKSI